MSDDAIPAPVNLGPGDKVADYRLEEQIGEGGMAVVYQARDERLNRQVALKLLTPSLTTDATFRTRFVRESRVVAAVEHPHIVPVYDTGDFGGLLYIAMRYIRGGDVRALRHHRPAEARPIGRPKRRPAAAAIEKAPGRRHNWHHRLRRGSGHRDPCRRPEDCALRPQSGRLHQPDLTVPHLRTGQPSPARQEPVRQPAQLPA
jgi:hypothetical protein